jgi:Domain of unknown function (DUF4375)
MDDRIKKIIDEGKNRPIYKSLDETTLAVIANEKIEQAIIDFVDARLAARAPDQDEVQVLASLPAAMRALYLTWAVESEVINGGFIRFYWTWMGQLADDAVAAFEFFSAHKHAHLMREANRSWAEEIASAGLQQVEDTGEIHFPARLHVLEDRFYKLDESLSALRIAKVRAEPSAFSVARAPRPRQ